MYYRETDSRLTTEEIQNYIKDWNTSDEKKRLMSYKSYYESENIGLLDRVEDRERRRKTPNNFVPSGYYSTLVDTMGGYLFQNINYSGDESIIDILNQNYVEIKDMNSGTNALAYNRGIELVYTSGDSASVDIRFAGIKTESVILIYNMDIEPDLYCAIRIYKTGDKKIAYKVDVIYKDLWEQYSAIKSNTGEIKEITKSAEDKQLFFKECPVVVYNTEIISEKSSFHSVISYIEALDWILTGNTNEIDRLVDAILVLGKQLKKEDLDKMDEMKALMSMKQEDRAEYITKDMSPDFREYVSKLLIQEIHKHSHIVDWYNPESSAGGDASAKALKTRLFDMDMFSKRIEMVYRLGIEKRIRLISQVMNVQGKQTEDVKIEFNRSVPSDFEDKVMALNAATFLSTQTKVEKVGLDWIEEEKRLKAESSMMDLIGDIDDTGTNAGDGEA